MSASHHFNFYIILLELLLLNYVFLATSQHPVVFTSRCLVLLETPLSLPQSLDGRVCRIKGSRPSRMIRWILETFVLPTVSCSHFSSCYMLFSLYIESINSCFFTPYWKSGYQLSVFPAFASANASYSLATLRAGVGR